MLGKVHTKYSRRNRQIQIHGSIVQSMTSVKIENRSKIENPKLCGNSPTGALKPIGYSRTNPAELDVAPEQPNA
jgi:hypothetical protein